MTKLTLALEHNGRTFSCEADLSEEMLQAALIMDYAEVQENYLDPLCQALLQEIRRFRGQEIGQA
jgi:hypothetical protein